MLKIKSLFIATALVSTLGASAAFAEPLPRDRFGTPDRARPVPQEVERVHASRGSFDWASLGELRVGGRFQAATLDVGRQVGQLTRLRLEVRSGDLGGKRVVVTFGNGSTYSAQMAGRAAVIDLPGQARNVRSIAVESARGGRRIAALVDVQGERAPRQAFR